MVVDTSFDLKTADPAREFETTGAIVSHAIYETLLTFKGDDVTQPVDGLASYTMSDDAKVMTLTVKEGHTFSDGSPLTVDDVVFSLERVQGIKGNPSFLLDGIKIAKVDEKSLTMTSQDANPALPFILPNGALGIVNSKVVKANGGTTDANDGAEAFLNKTSAGSGPYELESYDVASQVVFTANKNYSGPVTRGHDRVILRNVAGPTQLLNIQAGDSQVALDLNPDQAKELKSGDVKLISGPSPYMIFVLMNQNPAVNKFTSNQDFMTAVRRGIDYGKIINLAGEGAVQPGGVIPSLFVGALKTDPSNSFDASASKAALAKSGYNGEEILLNFPNDITVQGLELQSIAVSVQAQLKSIGINIKLAPQPVATELDSYRGGKETLGLWYWGPDYPDPTDYLVFTPGQLVGLRAGWAADANAEITGLAEKAKAATGNEARQAAYEALQKAMNVSGPFIPLLQPAKNVATASTVSEVSLNPVWTIDLAGIK
ncbi:ABC transporter substrate-binding protein [Arthrobacter sp.]|uniref:ABC transporter substrate-binding protein n=1 Tax=Arthrobacter sp. TaxID=1667 RepID=UPI0026DED3D8|nr:ABC transporter substrate-binding protein [Arthrobacter sp.]MDO5753803.1 ABC transporter substrate-binding protein [Arthrobacter sp.]